MESLVMTVTTVSATGGNFIKHRFLVAQEEIRIANNIIPANFMLLD
jgi:hypothetical protein